MMNSHPDIVDCFALTHPGFERDHNEDAAISEPDLALFALSDGMGGHVGGEVASSIAVSKVKEIYLRGSFVGLESMLSKMFDEVSREIRLHGQNDSSLRGMGATLVVATLLGNTLWVAHVGDSRAYLHRSTGKTELLTKDHSVGNVLVRAVGGREGTNSTPDVKQVRVNPGDMLVLCSDGLHGPVASHNIANILKISMDCRDACKTLVNAALREGGPDNVTVVAVTFG